MNGGKRIVVFVASLGTGGAERVAARVCGWLCDAGHVVCLLTLSGVESDFYPCPAGVQRLGLDLQAPSGSLVGAILANLKRWRAVRKAVMDHRADVVLSLGDRSNVLMLLATLGMRCRKVISERADPVLQPLSRGWHLLRRWSYPMATLHVSQSSYASTWIRAHFPSLQCKVIGNAGDLEVDALDPVPGAGDQELVRILAVGRLSCEKGVDLLLRAMALARHRTKVTLQLHVAGDGEDRSALVAQAADLKLGDSVRFLGRVRDIRQVLLDADVFVMPSRWEGFPNAMIEAMALGLPVITARCKGGVEDILDTGAEPCALDFPPGDIEAMANRMVQLAEDAELRHLLAARGLKRAADYSPARIAKAWCTAIEAP